MTGHGTLSREPLRNTKHEDRTIHRQSVPLNQVGDESVLNSHKRTRTNGPVDTVRPQWSIKDNKNRFPKLGVDSPHA